MNQSQRKLKIASRDEPIVTRQQIALAQIEQQHREAKWTSFSEPQTRPTLPVDEILERSELYVVVDSPTPKFRMLLKWLGVMK